MTKKNNYSVFPPNKEFEKVVKRIRKSDKRTNIGLTLDATPVEKVKHNLCQKILIYQQDNNIPVKLLAKKLGVAVPKLEKVLYGHIDKFTLDELFSYSTQLFTPLKVQFIHEGKRDTIYAS